MQVRDARRLRARIVIAGSSNRQLAKAVGYKSHAYINRIVSGDIKTVTPEKARLIARHLKVDVDDLFVSDVSTPVRRSVKTQAAR
jgi:transcriptional regulator with XRE-family HTH domain